jgi:U3 small nucleolar ribonucleoprotein protein IMP3
MSMRKLHYHE